MSIQEVSARIAQLQAELGLRSPGVLGGGASPTSGSDFSAALSDLLGTQDTTGTSGTTGTASSGDPATGAASGTATGEQAVALARSYTGVKYLWGGTDPAKGLDCSGLVQLVYKRLGITVPRVADDQARVGTAVPSLAQARPGDLVFFGSPIHHVGIYVGGGQMIDAPHTGSTVGVHNVAGYGAVTAIRRMAPAGPTAAGRTADSLAVARAQLLSTAGLGSLKALTPAASIRAVSTTDGYARLLAGALEAQS